MNRNSQLSNQNLQHPHAILIVVEGERAGESFEIGQNGISIGRASQNDLALQSSIISREHAIIRYHPETNSFTLLDRGSRNGTWQNRMEIIGEVKLEDGDEIAIGSSVFKFKIFNHALTPSTLKKSHIKPIKIVFFLITFLFLSLTSAFIFQLFHSISSKNSTSSQTSGSPKAILTKVSGDASYEDAVALGTSRMLVAGAVDANDHRPISCKIYFKISHGSGILRKFQGQKAESEEDRGRRAKSGGQNIDINQKSIEGISLTEVTDEKTGLARIFLVTRDRDDRNKEYKEYKEYFVEVSSPNQVGAVEPFRVWGVNKKAGSPDELLKMAKLESERAERFERDGKLYESVRSWERAIETMFPIYLNSPLYPVYQQTITKYNRTKSRFDRLLEHEYNLARIAFEQGNMSDSLRRLEEVRSLLPNKNDPRYLKAKERALAISHQLSAISHQPSAKN